jgi:hypothetical protein
MRGKLWFLGGVAVGFVVGARAGRERYDQLVATARRMLDHPTVQEAAGVVQAQANRLYAEGKETVTERLSHTKLGERFGHRVEPADELGVPADLDPLGSSAPRPSERLP